MMLNYRINRKVKLILIAIFISILMFQYHDFQYLYQDKVIR